MKYFAQSPNTQTKTKKISSMSIKQIKIKTIRNIFSFFDPTTHINNLPHCNLLYRKGKSFSQYMPLKHMG